MIVLLRKIGNTYAVDEIRNGVPIGRTYSTSYLKRNGEYLVRKYRFVLCDNDHGIAVLEK